MNQTFFSDMKASLKDADPLPNEITIKQSTVNKNVIFNYNNYNMQILTTFLILISA
jgi:hypothetical protein